MKRIFVDFNNGDAQGRLRLNLTGTFESLKNQSIDLHENLEILLDDNDGLKVKGIIQFSNTEKIWVAKIDWNNIEHY